ncbi:MAG: type II CAAX endopeptidase family protein [Actinomycetota bacterium]|nr:type II CAAX endopeptidase family protein [Actinomycetota bacterium]MDP3630899.1 type II CAAX endopeptidase family protein [Actinomycetota bacterium]
MEIGTIPAEDIEATIERQFGIARAYAWPEVAKVLALYYAPMVLLLAVGAAWLLVDQEGLRQVLLGTADEASTAAVVASVVSLPGTLLALAYIALRNRLHGMTWASLGVRKAPLGRSLKYMFGFLALAVMAVLGLVAVMVALQVPEPEMAVRPARSASTWIWLLVGAVIIGPLGEELIHRGMIFGFLRHRHRVVIAALISSVIFALLHLSPVAFVTALPLGLYLCLMYQRLGSIVPGLVLHMSWNLLVSLAG